MLRVKKIASGYGQFDTTTSELTASMTFLASGKFDKVLIIIKSRNDCITPFVFYNKTLIQGAPENISYNIRAYLHWQSTDIDGLTIPLYKYSNAHITILAQHAPDKLRFSIAHCRHVQPAHQTRRLDEVGFFHSLRCTRVNFRRIRHQN